MAGVGQQWERQRVGAIKEERQANFGKYLFKKACLPHFRWSVWVGKARQTSEMFATLVWPTAAIPFLAARDAFVQTRSCCCGPTGVANIWGVCRAVPPTRRTRTRGIQPRCLPHPSPGPATYPHGAVSNSSCRVLFPWVERLRAVPARPSDRCMGAIGFLIWLISASSSGLSRSRALRKEPRLHAVLAPITSTRVTMSP